MRTFRQNRSYRLGSEQVSTPDQVKAARVAAGLTQQACADRFGYKLRSWQKKEECGPSMRALSVGEYELLLLLGDQHPVFNLRRHAQGGVMIQEQSQVVLTDSVPKFKLEPGDIGIVVHIRSDGGYVVRFRTTEGSPIGDIRFDLAAVRPLEHTKIPHARERGEEHILCVS